MRIWLFLGWLLSASAPVALGAESSPPTNAPSAAAAAEAYKPAPQDKLFFRIEEDPANSKFKDPEVIAVSALYDILVHVTRDADVSFTINANGKTLSDLSKEIKDKLEADYYQHATVHLTLMDQSKRPGRAFFFGEVKGEVPLPPSEPVKLSEAILKLGYSDYANLKKVRLNREDPVSKKTDTSIIDVDAILFKGDRSKDKVLQDGDRIEVKQKSVIF